MTAGTWAAAAPWLRQPGALDADLDLEPILAVAILVLVLEFELLSVHRSEDDDRGRRCCSGGACVGAFSVDVTAAGEDNTAEQNSGETSHETSLECLNLPPQQ
jgi:hypothetical protein